MSFALPRETGRPTIIRSDPSSSPIMTLVLLYRREARGTKVKGETENSQFSIAYNDHDSPKEDIQRLIDLKEAGRVLFKRRLEQIDGVAQAIITGGLEREILIQIEQVKLNSLNLTFDEVSSALNSANLNMPSGSIMKGLFRYSLRTLGEYKNVKDIEKTVVKKNSNGSSILVEDLVQQGGITENFKEREGLTRFNGNEAI